MINDSNDEGKFYFGLADTTFKEKYRNHIRDFKHEKCENSTVLAKYIKIQKFRFLLFLFMSCLQNFFC